VSPTSPFGLTSGSLREKALVPVLVYVVVQQSLVSSMGAPLVPLIARDYGVTLAVAQWALTASLLAAAVFGPLLGRLADLGRRRAVLLGATTLVLAGGLLSVSFQEIGFLLAGRALQGLGLALTPVAMAIGRAYPPADRQASAVATLSVSSVVGTALAYPTMTAIAAMWGLRASFLAGVVATIGVFVAVVVVVPEDHHRDDSSPRIDWWGAGLLGIATSSALLALVEGHTWGWSSPAVLGCIAGAFLTGAVWISHELRDPAPLIDLRLGARRATAGVHLAALLMGTGAFYFLALVVILLQADSSHGPGLDQPVTTAGLALVPYALTSVLGTRLIPTGRSGEKGSAIWLPLGGVFYFAGTVWLLVLHDQTWQVAVAMLLAGLGSGFTFKTLPTLIVRCVPERETGSALAFNNLLRFIGFGVGSALVVVVIESHTPPGEELSDSALKAALVVLLVVWAIAIASTHLAAPRRVRGGRHAASRQPVRIGGPERDPQCSQFGPCGEPPATELPTTP
jgi:MFS family permease